MNSEEYLKIKGQKKTTSKQLCNIFALFATFQPIFILTVFLSIFPLSYSSYCSFIPHQLRRARKFYEMNL